jgi:nucleoside-diphosphate-sugar epimerase
VFGCWGRSRSRSKCRTRAPCKAVLETEPKAIVHEATALADMKFSRNLDRGFAPTNRLRTEGTDALLAAAREAGVRRFVAQSFASLRYAREGGPVKRELGWTPHPSGRQGFAAAYATTTPPDGRESSARGIALGQTTPQGV